MFSVNRINMYQNNLPKQIKFGKTNPNPQDPNHELKVHMSEDDVRRHNKSVLPILKLMVLCSCAGLALVKVCEPLHGYLLPAKSTAGATSNLERTNELLDEFEQKMAGDTTPLSSGYDEIHTGLKKIQAGQEKIKAEKGRQLAQAENEVREEERQLAQTKNELLVQEQELSEIEANLQQAKKKVRYLK